MLDQQAKIGAQNEARQWADSHRPECPSCGSGKSIEHGDIIGLSMDFKSTKSKDRKVNTAIIFLSTASKLRYKNAPSLVVIADDHRRTFAPDARRYKRSRISPTREEETIVIPISSDELTWLSEAKSVDCQFGSTTFRLSDYQQRIVRNFAAQVKR